MLKCFAPLVPITLTLLLTACATIAPDTPSASLAQDSVQIAQTPDSLFKEAVRAAELQQQQDEEAQALDEHEANAEVEPATSITFLKGKLYQLPSLGALFEQGFKLIGTPYRAGGSSAKTGFDCSGFVSFLFREKAGITLPRSAREMASLPSPKISRHDLQPGDLVFFASRGRINHTGIYLGGDRFIHSSSSRSGGVRVDKLSSGYWNARYLTAKRVVDNK